MAFDKIVGVDGTTYQFPTLVRARIADNIEQVGSDENLAVIAALGPALSGKASSTHNHNLADLTNNGIDKLGDVEIGVVGPNGIALEDKHTLQYEGSTATWRNKVASGGVTVGDSRPTTPIPGDAWFDSNDGTLYVYYADANTSQWVQVQANSALEGTILARLGAVEGRATALEATPVYAPNYVLNGAMEINQRALNSTGVTTQQFTLDRWLFAPNGGTVTQSYQLFTPGTAPISGTEAVGYLRTVTSGQSGVNDYVIVNNTIEDVRDLAGKTVTVSFYAKAAVNGTQMAHEFSQNYGTGGSPTAAYDVPIPSNGSSKFTLTTSWARYSYTMTLPGLAGKTLGTTANTSFTVSRFWLSAGSGANSRTSSLGIQNGTIDLWGLQIEVGSTATPFHRASTSLQAELAACQRYYWRANKSATLSSIFGVGNSAGTAEAYVYVQFPVEMRTKPSSIDTLAASNYLIAQTGVGNQAATSIAISNQSEHGSTLYMTAVGLSSNTVYSLRSGVAGAYIGFNAEL